jgi:hypothetical protein
MTQNKELQLVTFEQAQLLKEVGFDWWVHDYCFYSKNSKEIKLVKNLYKNYNGRSETEFCIIYSAPTVAFALKWCRDVHLIHGFIEFSNADFDDEKDEYCLFDYKWGYSTLKDSMYYWSGEWVKTKNGGRRVALKYDTYEAAESALLTEILNILKNK